MSMIYVPDEYGHPIGAGGNPDNNPFVNIAVIIGSMLVGLLICGLTSCSTVKSVEKVSHVETMSYVDSLEQGLIDTSSYDHIRWNHDEENVYCGVTDSTLITDSSTITITIIKDEQGNEIGREVLKERNVNRWHDRFTNVSKTKNSEVGDSVISDHKKVENIVETHRSAQEICDSIFKSETVEQQPSFWERMQMYVGRALAGVIGVFLMLFLIWMLIKWMRGK